MRAGPPCTVGMQRCSRPANAGPRLPSCQATLIFPGQRHLEFPIALALNEGPTTITFPDPRDNRACRAQPLPAMLSSPGETEAGSAGTQPDQGITRSTVCRKALQRSGLASPVPGHFYPFGHPSYALKIQPSPSWLLPLSPASGLSGHRGRDSFPVYEIIYCPIGPPFFSPGS